MFNIDKLIKKADKRVEKRQNNYIKKLTKAGSKKRGKKGYWGEFTEKLWEINS